MNPIKKQILFSQPFFNPVRRLGDFSSMRLSGPNEFPDPKTISEEEFIRLIKLALDKGDPNFNFCANRILCNNFSLLEYIFEIIATKNVVKTINLNGIWLSEIEPSELIRVFSKIPKSIEKLHLEYNNLESLDDSVLKKLVQILCVDAREVNLKNNNIDLKKKYGRERFSNSS
jgi:hypothetical protein